MHRAPQSLNATVPYRLPERLGGGIVTVRLHSNDEDKQRKFNRAENVRQTPPRDPDFETL